MVEFSEETSDRSRRCTQGMLYAAVIHTPHGAAGLQVGAHGVGHQSVAVVCIVQGLASLGNASVPSTDGVGVGISATPAVRVCLSIGGHCPDHALFAPCLSDAVSVVHVGCPVATVGVKVGPGGGLDCEGVGGHGVLRC